MRDLYSLENHIESRFLRRHAEKNLRDERDYTISNPNEEILPPLPRPFKSSPMSHWVQIDAPPPGPHAPLIGVRLAGMDRVLAVDAQGIFHCFRWAWKADPRPNAGDNLGSGYDDNSDPEVLPTGTSDTNEAEGIGKGFSFDDLFIDKGCFIAQRELPSFRAIPRLPYAPPVSRMKHASAVVAISKTLFASRTLLLVLSDGDGAGALAMQLVDPSKSVVKGEVIVPEVHSSRITSIAMDPIGTAAGHGGVGGEVALVGSEDGSSTLWRFISSQFLPLRPRLRTGGHKGEKIHGVAICTGLSLCATISNSRCCLINMGNGVIMRSFGPPEGMSTIFADTQALCISAQGLIVAICQSQTRSGELRRIVISLELFNLEGIHIGTHHLEPFRGIPNKLVPIADGSAVMVCSGTGITVHALCVVDSLSILDEWRISEDEGQYRVAFDVDMGPSLMRPVVAAAACSSGALRLHALRGIGEWSEEHKTGGMSMAVGNALAKPAQRIKNVVGGVTGIGKRFVGFGKEIGQEAMSDVKERGVKGFLGGMMNRR